MRWFGLDEQLAAWGLVEVQRYSLYVTLGGKCGRVEYDYGLPEDASWWPPSDVLGAAEINCHPLVCTEKGWTLDGAPLTREAFLACLTRRAE
jgi:hypothetical protein